MLKIFTINRQWVFICLVILKVQACWSHQPLRLQCFAAIYFTYLNLAHAEEFKIDFKVRMLFITQAETTFRIFACSQFHFSNSVVFISVFRARLFYIFKLRDRANSFLHLVDKNISTGIYPGYCQWHSRGSADDCRFGWPSCSCFVFTDLSILW